MHYSIKLNFEYSDPGFLLQQLQGYSMFQFITASDNSKPELAMLPKQLELYQLTIETALQLYTSKFRFVTNIWVFPHNNSDFPLITSTVKCSIRAQLQFNHGDILYWDGDMVIFDFTITDSTASNVLLYTHVIFPHKTVARAQQ